MSAAENSVRADLEAAIKEHEAPEVEAPVVEAAEPEVTETPAEKEARARDEKGRFVAKPADTDSGSLPSGDKPADVAGDQGAAPIAPAPAAGDAKPEAQAALAPPNGWSAEAKAKWHELPPEIMAAVQKREQDVAKFTSTRDEHASFGKEMYQTVQPYLATIQAMGGTPATAVKSLLNTAYILNVGSPEQKRQALLQAAQTYGVDLGQSAAPEGQPQPVNVQAEIDRAFRAREEAARQAEIQRLQTEVQSEIEAFAADPKHPHYESVKGHMSALIAQGAAKDLQDAYDQAVWANPQTRATVLAQQRAEDEQKRAKAAADKAALARKKGVSVTGGPGSTVSTTAPGSKGSVRADLEDAFAAHSGGV